MNYGRLFFGMPIDPRIVEDTFTGSPTSAGSADEQELRNSIAESSRPSFDDGSSIVSLNMLHSDDDFEF